MFGSKKKPFQEKKKDSQVRRTDTLFVGKPPYLDCLTNVSI
jgi:hypothetical protein